MNFKKLFITLLLFLAALTGIRSAEAVTNRFSILNARPRPTEADFQFVYGSQGLFHLQWRVGTQADYAFRPLNGSTRRIIDRILIQDFFGAVGLFDRLTLGFDMPIAWHNNFQNPDQVAAPGFNAGMDLGDLRIEAKTQILSRYQFPVGLAVIPFFHLPTGNASRFVGDSQWVGGGVAALDLPVGKRLLFGLNAGVEYKDTVNLSNVNLSKTNLLLGVGALAYLTPRFDISAEGTAKTPLGNIFKEEAETPIEILGSLRFKVIDGLTLSGGGGGGFVYGVGAPRFRGFLGAAYTGSTENHRQKLKEMEETRFGPGSEPEVQWAVMQLRQNCPEDPAQFDPAKHDAGCSKLFQLREIASLSLICPSQAEQFDPAVHDPECRKVYQLRKELSQEEYATVYVLAAEKLEGKCPDNPTAFNPVVHDAACPKIFEIRETVSLVARCPEKSQDFNPEIHDPGCPKVYALKSQYSQQDIRALYVLSQSDVDHDGILDIEDKCPQRPGIAAAFGCPEVEVVFKKGQLLGTKVPISFEFNKWRINSEIGEALNDVCEILNNHPEVQRVRIEGHADRIGTKKGNTAISQRRALSVKRFLKSCGVKEERLNAVWFGAQKPIASNNTPAGRAQNRRATVLVVEIVSPSPSPASSPQMGEEPKD